MGVLFVTTWVFPTLEVRSKETSLCRRGALSTMRPWCRGSRSARDRLDFIEVDADFEGVIGIQCCLQAIASVCFGCAPSLLLFLASRALSSSCFSCRGVYGSVKYSIRMWEHSADCPISFNSRIPSLPFEMLSLHSLPYSTSFCLCCRLLR